MTDLNQFVQDAIRTESHVDQVIVREQLFMGILHTLISAGNILDMIKKNAFYGKEIDEERLTTLLQSARDGIMIADVTHKNEDLHGPLPINPRLFHAIVGINTEGTELLEALRDILGGKDPDSVNIKEELGDINWYEAIAIDTLEADFESVLNTVIAKLKVRFPDKFTSEDAINRDLVKERQILEG